MVVVAFNAHLGITELEAHLLVVLAWLEVIAAQAPRVAQNVRLDILAVQLVECHWRLIVLLVRLERLVLRLDLPCVQIVRLEPIVF